MNRVLALFALLFAYLVTPSAAYANTITIAAGTTPAASVYARIIEEMISVCSASVSPDFTLTRIPANGSNATVEALTGKDAMMGVVQMDVMNIWIKNRPELDFREVASLHQEAYQFLGLPSVSSGFLGLSSKPITSVEDLSSLTIGVTGAGELSLEYFNFLTKLNIKSQLFATTEELVAAVKAKKVAGMLLVTGYPSAVVKGMSGVVPLGMKDDTITAILGAKKGYAPVRMSYSNLSNAQVKTVAVRAMLVSLPFRSEKLKAAANKLGECVTKNADSMVDNPKMHPAWATIKGNESAGLPRN
jgi:TRAP-type uncharacterized transport system substrate-binding protein